MIPKTEMVFPGKKTKMKEARKKKMRKKRQTYDEKKTAGEQGPRMKKTTSIRRKTMLKTELQTTVLLGKTTKMIKAMKTKMRTEHQAYDKK